MTASAPPCPEAAPPLAGVRVLDLSRVLAGPWCTQILADLGADVIKVERPARDGGRGGDDTRGWGPPYLKDREGRDTGESAYFLSCNRNKRSITVDLAHPEGAALLRELAARSDVLVENFKVGNLAKYGLDAASLAEVNPGLVYCSITGFGQDGPMAELAGYDLMVQGLGGLMSITGEPDGRPGGGPQKVGVAVVDLMTGLYATVAIQAALAARARTGRGQHVDAALFDTQLAMLANLGSSALLSGAAPRRVGNAHPSIAPYQSFSTADGHMLVAVGNDAQFARYCAALGHAEWSADARFETNDARVRHRDELVALLAPAMLGRTTAEWIAALDALKVPCGPINDVAQALALPQTAARGMVRELPHPLSDALRVVGSPIRLSQTPVQYRRPPPLLGEHTGEVLQQWLGLDAGRLDELKRKGVI
ncbi:CaiB/BaiF CoA transferase family protein [Caldimonas tepidiphila]|uniref:CaiB/BaiF CoA transferase family protein n=1 Tax=Caldimonas tepidiphila TaxID=2315841 RepID=UPI000E5B742F|nr:CaiB/BaiF CoA-transferase family protein [Caldimonas tepidiphila]